MKNNYKNCISAMITNEELCRLVLLSEDNYSGCDFHDEKEMSLTVKDRYLFIILNSKRKSFGCNKKGISIVFPMICGSWNV
jgi:hypothetical protein